MTIYWMLNNHWPSFFGNIFDYYLRPGGAYYGAKKGLQPLSVVFDSYATGDHTQAHVTLVNQTPDRPVGPASAGPRLRPAGPDARRPGRRRPQPCASGGSVEAMTLPRVARDSSVFFVRCEVVDEHRNRSCRKRLLAVAAARRSW